MSFERSCKELKSKTRHIPLHYQRKYLTNVSNGSFNATFLTGLYKNKIKSLRKNNHFLALALQNDRLKTEELLAESKANTDLIMFSTLKLSNMSENLKRVVSEIDETLSIFQRHSSEGFKKFTPKNTVRKEEFKEQLRDVVMEPIIEETEPPCQPGVIPTNKRVIPVPAVTTPSTYEICHSLKSKISEENKVTKNVKQINLIETRKISKEMFVKNSPLKEVCADYESNEKKTSVKAKKKAEIVSIKANKEKELQVNSQIKRKSILKGSNVLKSIGTNDCKKNKAKSVKFENSKINEESENDNFAKRVLCKNRKTKISEKASDNLIKEGILCSNSTYSTPEISSAPLENFQNLNFEIFSEIYTARKPNEVNNDISKLQKLQSCENLNQGEVRQGAKIFEMCRRPLKSLSSEKNIEHLANKKVSQKPKAFKIDDLTVDMPSKGKNLSKFLNKKKSYKSHCITDTKSLITNNYTNYENTPLSNINLETNCSLPKSEFNFDYHQGEVIVKNLASDIFVVTPEVHEQSDDSLSEEELKSQNFYSIPSVVPVMHPTDIFEARKSFCKNISNPADEGNNRIPLEVQHLEPLEVQNLNSLNILGSSVDQKCNNCERTTTLLTSDETEKVQSRRRTSQICYKEPKLNSKLRR